MRHLSIAWGSVFVGGWGVKGSEATVNVLHCPKVQPPHSVTQFPHPPQSPPEGLTPRYELGVWSGGVSRASTRACKCVMCMRCVCNSSHVFRPVKHHAHIIKAPFDCALV